MGTGTGGYVTINLQTYLSKWTGSDLKRQSKLFFEPAPTPLRTPLNLLATSPPAPGDPPAAKIGVGVKKQDVPSFKLFADVDGNGTSWIDLGAVQRDTITDELKKTFPDYDWAGYALALGPSGSKFNVAAAITFKLNFHGTVTGGTKKIKRPFKLIPIVLALGTDQFADHHLLSVVVAHPIDDILIDTTVTQPY